MSQIYDPETDTILVTLADGVIEDTDEVSPGVLVDLDKDGNPISYEFMMASRRFADPRNADVMPFLRVFA